MAELPSSPSPTANPLLEAALQYAALGWTVFPCKPRSKTPLVQGWPTAATVNTDQLREWWSKWPDANVGLATKGLLVVDTDGPEGEAALVARGDLPPAPTAITGKGRHRFFKDTRNAARCKVGVLPQVDIRAAGGCVIVAPSVHPSGAAYRWAPGLSLVDLMPPPAPQWLYDLKASSPDLSPSADALVPIPEGEPIPEGQRNNTLFGRACGLLAAGVASEQLLARLEAINRADCKPPLEANEVQGIAASASRFANNSLVRLPRELLKADLHSGPLALYVTRQALVQTGMPRPKQKDLASALGVTNTRTIRTWTTELRAADLGEYKWPETAYVLVPVRMLKDPQVPHAAKVTALHLLAYPKDGSNIATVSRKALVQITGGRSESSIQRDLDALRARGHLSWKGTPFNAEKGSREGPATYTFA